jgi:hypothetical protein
MIPAAIAMWLPSLVFLIFTLVFIWSVARESHTLYMEKFNDSTYALLSKFRKSQRGI